MPLPAPLRRAALLAAATVAATSLAGTASAAQLATSYDLAGTLAPSAGERWLDEDAGSVPAPPLEPVGGTVSYAPEPSIAAPRDDVAVLDAGEGLTLNDTGIEESESFAVAVSLRLDQVDPDPAVGTNVPVLSFDAGASGTGVVVRDGVLGWWYAPTATFTPVRALADGAWHAVVLNRTAGGRVHLDLGGASASVDPSAAVPSAFGTDVRLLGPGAGSARVARVRTWRGTLSADETDAATAAISDTVAPSALDVFGFSGADTGSLQVGTVLLFLGSVEDDATAPADVTWSLRAGTCAGAVVAAGDAATSTLTGLGGQAVTSFDAYAEVAGIVDGAPYALCLTATDRRGNAVTRSVPVVGDRAAPPLTIDTPPTNGSAAFSGTAEPFSGDDGGVVSVALWRVNAAGVGWDRVGSELAIVQRDGRWATGLDDGTGRPVVTLPEGRYSLQASTCDHAYNCAEASRTFVVTGGGTVTPPPPPPPTPRPPVTLTPLPPVPFAPPPATGQAGGPAAGFLASAVTALQRQGALGRLLRPYDVLGAGAAAGRVQVQLFAGAAPKKAVTYGATSKLPRNLVTRGTATLERAGVARVRLSPTARARKLVGRRASLRGTVRTVFVPARGGKAVAEDRKVVLKR